MRRTSDYHYDLPAERIAQVPAEDRAGSRLLVVGEKGVTHSSFAAIAEWLPEGAVLVVNDTRVWPARLRGHKETGGSAELLLLEPVGDERRWRCMARASKPFREGQFLAVGDAQVVIVSERDADGTLVVEFDRPAAELCAAHGETPLPPYIERDGGPRSADVERYQTVYAREPGAVAAPTAGLHFTDELLHSLESERGLAVAPLTLHVGAGTFAPVRAEAIDDHRMHSERYSIPAETARLVRSGRPVVAVGTTAVRALESAARNAGELEAAAEAVVPAWKRTDIFITPGFEFRVVDHLITNFHLPESTLLMLVCAFAGYERVMSAYREAVASDYRFYSYGDAMLLTRMTEKA